MIPLLDLTAQYHSIQPEIDAAVQSVLESGQFILGPQVAAFEMEVAGHLGVREAIGVASGTDALVLALRALDIGRGDEVIVPAYTFFATVSTVMQVGARPVMVDIDPRTYCLDVEQVADRLSSHTKAIIPVHLYGHPADLSPLQQLARQHGLSIIEDNAQAFGSVYHGQKTGTLGDINCLSFFPTKNLGAFGDGGMVVTNDEGLARRVRMLRTHGWKRKYYSEELGYNSRLDAIQAAILRVKLQHVETWNERRRALAAMYSSRLADLAPAVITPYENSSCRHVYHLYVLRSQARDDLQASLKEAGIASEVYYPVPPHLTKPCRQLGYKEGDFPVAEQASRATLAIPLYPEMSLEQLGQVVEAVRGFVQA